MAVCGQPVRGAFVDVPQSAVVRDSRNEAASSGQEPSVVFLPVLHAVTEALEASFVLAPWQATSSDDRRHHRAQ